MFCIKRGIEQRCAVVACVCEIHFPFSSFMGGEPADCLELYAGFLGIRYMAFSDRMSLQLLMLLGK